MFNDPDYVKEFAEYVGKLKIKSSLEVGCRTREMLDAIAGTKGIDIDPQVDDVERVDLMDFDSKKKFELVYSSGVLEHYDRRTVVKMLRKKASLSRKYVLTLVPNKNCGPYQRVKHRFHPEDCYSVAELIETYQKAGLKVVDSGTMASAWCKNRFGAAPEDGQGYLTYCLGVVE